MEKENQNYPLEFMHNLNDNETFSQTKFVFLFTQEMCRDDRIFFNKLSGPINGPIQTQCII